MTSNAPTLAFLRLHKNVVDHELLRYMRLRESKCGFPGRVYGRPDFDPSTPDTMTRLHAICDDAFGRVETA